MASECHGSTHICPFNTEITNVHYNGIMPLNTTFNMDSEYLSTYAYVVEMLLTQLSHCLQKSILLFQLEICYNLLKIKNSKW